MTGVTLHEAQHTRRKGQYEASGQLGQDELASG